MVYLWGWIWGSISGCFFSKNRPGSWVSWHLKLQLAKKWGMPMTRTSPSFRCWGIRNLVTGLSCLGLWCVRESSAGIVRPASKQPVLNAELWPCPSEGFLIWSDSHSLTWLYGGSGWLQHIGRAIDYEGGLISSLKKSCSTLSIQKGCGHRQKYEPFIIYVLIHKLGDLCIWCNQTFDLIVVASSHVISSEGLRTRVSNSWLVK